jgi:hypothetical protein
MTYTCQMTVSSPEFPGSSYVIYGKCGRPAKFITPKPKMGVEYICGVHANSLNKFYKRTGQNITCQKLPV